MMITSASYFSFTTFVSSNPLTPGILTSAIIMSTRFFSRNPKASSPLASVQQVYPASWIASRRTSLMPLSSSTTRIWAPWPFWPFASVSLFKDVETNASIPHKRLAEREGFEPSVQLNTAHSLSRRAPSASSAISPGFC